jgi:hypothetical protein
MFGFLGGPMPLGNLLHKQFSFLLLATKLFLGVNIFLKV